MNDDVFLQNAKPCPFCAYTKVGFNAWPVNAHGLFSHTEYTVYCKNCGAEGPNDLGKSGAVEIWNLRRKFYNAPDFVNEVDYEDNN